METGLHLLEGVLLKNVWTYLKITTPGREYGVRKESLANILGFAGHMAPVTLLL